MWRLIGKASSFACFLAFSFCLQTTLFAAPHNGDVFRLKQPDGSYVKVKVWGDEFYQRVESLDGYTLVRDPETRWICYAELSGDESELVPTDAIYQGTPIQRLDLEAQMTVLEFSKHLDLKGEVIRKKVAQARQQLLEGQSDTAMEARSAMAFESLTGPVLGLTLLIEFPDESATIPKAEIENYLNQNGYSNYENNGSVRDYFDDVSGGLLDYTNYATEYYTAENDKSYYTDEAVDHGVRARELINDALDWLDGRGFDFSTLSTDADGYIRAINALYAGSVDNAWGEGLWPHMGYLWPEFHADGVRSGYYQITNIGDQLRLRTFCHENGHMLFGWPDLYDYDRDSRGIGNYGLMAGGASNRNPVPPNPSLRSQAGWETISDITNHPSGALISHTANSLTTYRYSHPNDSDEYFLIESRVQTGRNAELPDQGLLIWHVDESVGGNDDQQMTPSLHYRVSVEQADGAFHLENDENPGSSGDLFRAGYADAFHDSTTPDAHWWSGDNSGLDIRNISPVGTTMSFTIGQVRVWRVDDDAEDDPNPGDPNGSDPNEDGSFEHPYDSIQEAINEANDGDIIMVLDGTYTGLGNYNIDTNGLAVRVRSQSQPKNCVIDCQSSGRAFLFQNGEDANTVLDGFTITNGYSGSSGGAIYCHQSSPTITNCIITDSYAIRNGGAICCRQNSGPTITNCLMTGNQADWSGGAIFLEVNCSATIHGCTISTNNCGSAGGGIESCASNPTIKNCIITDNSGIYSGALTSSDSSNTTIINCTIADNIATNPNGAGGLECYSGHLTVANSILWNNTGKQIDDAYGTASVIYSDVQIADSNWPGIGNINDAPLFADPNNGDYHLKSSAGRWSPGSYASADFNNDHITDFIDLEILAGYWLDAGEGIVADLNSDESVNFADFALFACDWDGESYSSGWLLDAVNSPCIDAGDPNSDYSLEPSPNGGRINMGAYGNTEYASKSAP